MPGSLSTVMEPFDCFTMPSTTERPSPVPSPTDFVVKNGSKLILDDLGRNANARVADHEPHVEPRLDAVRVSSGRRDTEVGEIYVEHPALLTHGEDGVGTEVHDNLLDPPGVAEDQPRLLFGINLDVDG